METHGVMKNKNEIAAVTSLCICVSQFCKSSASSLKVENICKRSSKQANQLAGRQAVPQQRNLLFAFHLDCERCCWCGCLCISRALVGIVDISNNKSKNNRTTGLGLQHIVHICCRSHYRFNEFTQESGRAFLIVAGANAHR